MLRWENRVVSVEIKAETAGDPGRIVEDFQRSRSAERIAFRRYDFFDGLTSRPPAAATPDRARADLAPKKISSPSLLSEELFGSEINEEKGGTYRLECRDW